MSACPSPKALAAGLLALQCVVLVLASGPQGPKARAAFAACEFVSMAVALAMLARALLPICAP
jgi:hypothetical protein